MLHLFPGAHSDVVRQKPPFLQIGSGASGGLVEGFVVGLTDGNTEDGFAAGLNEDGFAEGLAVGFTEGTTEDGCAMNPVSVTQLAGLEQWPPISQEPVQQLALTIK